MSTPNPTPSAAPANALQPKRRRALLTVTAGVVLVAAVWGGYWFFESRHHVTTDNAYVQGNVVQITPLVSGTVLAINADDTDFVKVGQPLVRLDAADAKVALDQAQAQLGQTVREVRALYANNSSFAANIKLREADVVKARTELQRVEDDAARRMSLSASGAVSTEEQRHAQAAVASARSALAAAEAATTAAREQLSANQALTEGTGVEQHPRVQRAAAQLREAYLAYKRVDLPAPVSGYVAKRSVQVGQRVQAGTPLMAVIALDQLWVDANFKEVQLREMRIGQPVKLVADVYGSKVEYDGHVAGLGAGTGSAFALLPAQNASGNWIKVVQRVPVRIVLDAKQIAEHPLRVGLSMEVDVDVSDKSGRSLAEAPHEGSVAQTQVFDAVAHDADALVAKIITANLRGAPAHAPVANAPAANAPATVGAEASALNVAKLH